MSLYKKDPHATLDFAFDWNDTTSPWLATGETITTYTITAQEGITLETVAPHAQSQASGKVTFWLSGGTAETTYTIACKIVTSASRTDERTMRVTVKDR
jgi:hypothetical protein